jgi:hypothetical protein
MILAGLAALNDWERRGGRDRKMDRSEIVGGPDSSNEKQEFEEEERVLSDRAYTRPWSVAA